MSDSFPHTRPLVPMPLSIWLFPNYPCMHAKSLQLCLTLCDPMDCGPPSRLLCPWDSPGKNTGVGCHALLQGIFPTQRMNPSLLHCRWILYHLSHQGSPLNRDTVSKNNQFLLGKKREWIWVGNCFWHSLPLCSPISRRDIENAITSCLKESGPSYYPIAVSSSAFRVAG